MECLHQHGWFEDLEHSRQSRVKKQRGSEEMFGQSRAEVEQSIDRQGRGRVAELGGLKGKLGNFFLLAQSFYWAQTKRSLNRQF